MTSSVEPIPSAPSEIFADQYLGRRVAKGAAWMVMKRVSFRAVGLISNLILARLLMPEAVGLVALASVAYDLLDVLTEFSFTLALVKMKEPTRAHFDTAWTLVVVRGLLIGALMVVGAPALAEFVHEPRLVDITRVLALVPVLQGLENVGLIEFQRSLRFDRIFWYELIGRLVGFVLVIPAALILHNAWALVIGYLGPKLVTVPYSYFLHPYRPRFSLKAGRELLNFSKWLFATNLMYILRDYTMVLLLGRVGGASATGLYQQSWQIGVLPASEIAAPVRRPMYSGYAKVLDDRDRLRAQVVDGLALVLMMITPASVGIALTAGLVQAVGLGPNWVGAAPLLTICAIYALIEAVGEFTHNLYVVHDRQRRFVEIMTALIVVRTGLVIWAGLTHGVLWAVWAMAAVSFFSTSILFTQLIVIIDLSVRRVIAALWRVMVATAVMASGVAYLQYLWPQSGQMPEMIGQLSSQIALGAFLYIGVLIALWRASGRPSGAEAHALEVLQKGLARMSRRGGRVAAAEK